MALPTTPEARLFYQAAKQRLGDAQFRLGGGRNRGAVYLAGYAGECVLKALILAAVPKKKIAGVVESFRGARAHDYVWLKVQYHEHGGPQFPAEVSRPFEQVNTWATH